MANTGTAYERALRDILEAGVYEPTGTVPQDFDRFVAVRAGGSKGKGGDLVAIRGTLSLPIEVKTSAKMSKHLGGPTTREGIQAEDFGRRCYRARAVPIYAYYAKSRKVHGDKWRLFRLPFIDPGEPLPDSVEQLMDILPETRTTAAGNQVLDFERGRSLWDFLFATSGIL